MVDLLPNRSYSWKEFVHLGHLYQLNHTRVHSCCNQPNLSGLTSNVVADDQLFYI
jgi:hypothetical protein